MQTLGEIYLPPNSSVSQVTNICANKTADRRQDHLHPSEMAHSDWCPRQSNYRLLGTKPSDLVKAHGVILENIFDEGNQIHDKWQQRMWDMGRLWGKWECLVCCHMWFGISPLICPDCGFEKRALRYREVPLDGEAKWLISGHEDGGIPDLRALVEVKSIGNGSLRMEDPTLLSRYLKETVDGKKVYDLDGIWKDLKRPLPGHVRQTAIYMAIAKEMGLPYDVVVFIYEYKANQLTKEFHVKYNPRISEPLLDKALDIKYALSKGTVVSRQSNFTEEHKPCTTCPYKTLCFGATNDSSGDTSSEAGKRKHLGSSGPSRRGRKKPVGGGDGPTRVPEGCSANAPHGSNGSGRPSADVSVQRVDLMADLPGSEIGRQRGRREVRRRTT